MSPKRWLEDAGDGGGAAEDVGEGGSRSAPPPKRRRRLGGRELKRSRSFDLTLQVLATSYLQMMEVVEAETAITRALVEERSNKDAYECLTCNLPDYEMNNSRLTTPAPKSTEATDKITHGASSDTEFSGGHSQQSTFKMLGSKEVRPQVFPYESNNLAVTEHEQNHPCCNLVLRKLESIEEQIQVLTQSDFKNQTIITSALGKLESIQKWNQILNQKFNLTSGKRENNEEKNQVLTQKENLASGKLETMEQIQTATQREDEIVCSCHNHHNNELLVQDVKHEATSAKAKGLATDEGMGQSTNVRLCFLNGINTIIYHDVEIKSKSNAAIKVGIFDGGTMIKSGPLSKVKIEIVALEGNFPYDIQGSWSSKEFNDHIASGRHGKGNVLVGEGRTARLIDGELDLVSIKFGEGSCRARNGKFIIGARVCQGESTDVPVHEAIMKPVVVHDRRNKFNEKSYPPKLDDKVYRLEEIAKNGRYCTRLKTENIHTVQDFLRALNKNTDNLTKILQINKEHKIWKKMVRHARMCCLEGKQELISYGLKENVVLFFDCVYSLVGAAFGGCYTGCNKFNPGQQLLVDKLKRSAYDHLDDLCPDYVMTDKFPVPIYDTNAGSGAVPSYISNATQRKTSGYHAGCQVGGTTAVKVSSNAKSSGANANNDPGSSFSPDHQSTHDYPVDQGRQLPDQEFSASLIDLLQDTLELLNSCDWETEESLGYKDDTLAHLLDHLETINSVEPRLGQEEIQRDDFFWQGNGTFQASTSVHSNMISRPNQPTSSTTSGVLGSAQGASAESSSSQGSLPPRQWSQCQGGMP